jgi:histidine triad (HIT) family protein
MESCVFCRIAAGQIPARIDYQDDLVTAFRDIHPAAPVHILIIPNRHLDSLNDLSQADELLAGRLLTVARQLAEREGIQQSGYRLIANTGPHGGQTVYHMHLHLLGGGYMRNPIG